MSNAKKLPPPSNPMAVARVMAIGFQSGGHLTLRRWRGSWMQWQESFWAEVPVGQVRTWMYERLEHAQFTDNTGKVPVPKPWAPNRHKVADVVDALEAITYLPQTVTPPAWLGPERPAPADEIVACSNGLLHVGTRKLIEHTPQYFGLVAVPFGYDPTAPKPVKWLEFLSQLWPDDQDSIDALQEFFGYVLSGRTDLHKIMLLIGPTRSGKGTIARILTALVGRGNAAGPTLASLATQFGMAPLIGKPLAVVSDARLGGANENQVVERLLSISGEDMLTVDIKFKETWTGQLPARFLILSNELPRFGDASGAIADRFIVLVMSESFLGRENSGLTAELMTELPGILSWSLDGLDRLAKAGSMTSPASSTDAIVALHDLVSPVSAFVRDHCTIGGEVAVDELFTAWKDWADLNNHRAGTSATFGRNLRAVVPMLRMVQPWVEDKNASDGKRRERHYVGLSLTTPRSANDRVPSRAEPLPAEDAARDGTRSDPLQCQVCSEPLRRYQDGQIRPHPHGEPS
jgi:putative DNA primase/helicase